MVESPSWEANWFAASQEIPRISRNPKVHYRTHKRPPAVPILGQPNPVHIPTSHLLRSILILSTHLRLGLPSFLFPSDFPTKTLYTASPHPFAPHVQPISFLSILHTIPTFIHSFIHSLYMHICNIHSDPFTFSFKVIRFGESFDYFFADFLSGREQDRQCACNVTSWRVRVTVVVMEK